MLIGSRPKLHNLSDTMELLIDSVPVELVQVSFVKLLGILYVDEHLTWQTQTDNLSKKIFFWNWNPKTN